MQSRSISPRLIRALFLGKNGSLFPAGAAALRSAFLCTAVFFTAVSALSGCDGVDSRDTETATTVARNTNTFRSLRLGQTESPNSPVATTAAANNGEAIIVLNRAPGSIAVDHVLYLSASSDVARITYADGNLPSSAEGGGVTFVFSNYTASTVDVQVSASGSAPFVATVPITDTVQKLLPQVAAVSRAARAAESPEVLMALYTRAIIGIELFGCGASDAFAGAGIVIPAGLSELAQSACSSLLVDLLRAFVSTPDFAAQVISGISEEPACNFSEPGWIEDFDKARQCALGVGGDLINAILSISPSVQIAVAPTPEPTPTPEPSSNSSSGSQSSSGGGSSLNCSLGRFRCDDGGRTCNEFACNAQADCRDGSDESNTLCTAEVLCCIASQGCPGENAGACSAGCCCCPSGKKCSRSPYLDGCVTDND